MKRWKWILLSAVFLLLVGAGGFGYSLYRLLTVSVPNAYAQWGAAELVMLHMDANNGAWPKSWDDLKIIHARRHTHWDFGGGDFETLKVLVEIDWNADPKELAKAPDGGDEPPFQVIRLRDGSKAHWQGAEPNQFILDYLKGRKWVLDQGWRDDNKKHYMP